MSPETNSTPTDPSCCFATPTGKLSVPPAVRRPGSRRLRISIAASLVVLTSSGIAAQVDPVERKILVELSMRTSIDIHKVPLKDIAEYLTDLHNVPFAFDTEAFDRARINYRPMTFTLKEKDVPLWAVLRHVLDQHKLSFMVKDQRVLFTTPEAAREWQKTFLGDAIDPTKP